MKSFKRTATISKRSPGILLRVPRRCTNGSEEVFHRRFIAIEQLAVEVTWVPIDYYTPQIEDCGTIFCHCKYILSFLRESSIMFVSGNTEIIGETPVSQSATCRQLRSSGGATALGPEKNELRRNSFTVVATRMKQEALKFAIRGIQKGVANVRSPDQRPHE